VCRDKAGGTVLLVELLIFDLLQNWIEPEAIAFAHAFAWWSTRKDASDVGLPTADTRPRPKTNFIF
jgi:hypothetical protein